jgi:hypothetical protein
MPVKGRMSLTLYDQRNKYRVNITREQMIEPLNEDLAPSLNTGRTIAEKLDRVEYLKSL